MSLSVHFCDIINIRKRGKVVFKLKYTYNIVHRLPNGQELVIASVGSRREVEYVTETAKYQGTWLSDDLKLLRYGLGLIEVREEKQPVAIVSQNLIREANQVKLKLELVNEENVGWLVMTDDMIYAYDHSDSTLLWEAASFATLAFKINKDIAYECMQLYDKQLHEGSL